MGKKTKGKLLTVLGILSVLLILGIIFSFNTQQSFFEDWAKLEDTKSVKWQLVATDMSSTIYVDNPSGSGCVPVESVIEKSLKYEPIKEVSTEKSKFRVEILNLNNVGKCGAVYFDYKVYKDNNLIDDFNLNKFISENGGGSNTCANLDMIGRRNMVSYTDEGKVIPMKDLTSNQTGITVFYGLSKIERFSSCAGSSNNFVLNKINVKNPEVVQVIPNETQIQTQTPTQTQDSGSSPISAVISFIKQDKQDTVPTEEPRMLPYILIGLLVATIVTIIIVIVRRR